LGIGLWVLDFGLNSNGLAPDAALVNLSSMSASANRLLCFGHKRHCNAAGHIHLLLVFGALGVALFGAETPAAEIDPNARELGIVSPDLAPDLAQVGAKLLVVGRPAWPKPLATSTEVTLVPQTEAAGTCVVSFGLPFPPDTLKDDKQIRVLSDGTELAAFTQPLVHWWLDRKQGALRSVLVQFEMASQDRSPRKITVAWDKPRARSRPALTPISQTQDTVHFTPEPKDAKVALAFDYLRPKVLALLPAPWLCDSLVAWQQVPAEQNQAAPWFDKHLAEQFDGSLRYISASKEAFEAHLFDRPATYAKVYVRSGQAKHLLAALQANEFYIQHLTANGVFDLKPGNDLKYVYSEGSALMFMLTGDERYRQAVERAAKSWEGHAAIEYKGRGFWTERHHGFGMLAAVHAYEITGEPRYLDRAARFFEAAYAMQVKPVDGKPPDGAWVHSGDSHGDGNGWTTSPWMSCFLTDAIWKYWMLSGEPRCPASLALYAKFAQLHAVTPNGRGMWYMANSPGRGKSEDGEDGPHNMEGLYLMALGRYLSKATDGEFMKKFQSLQPAVVEDPANRPGRKFNWRFRETSMLVWFLSETERH